MADEIRALAAAGLHAHDALAAGSWAARRYLGLGGLSPGAPADAVVYDADPLRAATSVNAELLGCDDLGRIGPGAVADLLVLDADPLRDPSVLWGDPNRRAVFQGGIRVAEHDAGWCC